MMTNPISSRVAKSTRRILLFGLCALVAATAIACGEEGGIGGAGDADFTADPDPLRFTGVNVGDSDVETVTITNTGSGDLELWDLQLVNEAGDALEPQGDWPSEMTIAEDESEDLSVRYTPTDEQDHSGYISVQTNDSDLEGEPAIIDIETAGFASELFVDPEFIDFPQTPAGSSDYRLAEVHNIGAGTLSIESIEVTSGDNDYSALFYQPLTQEDVDADPDLEDSAVGSPPPIEDHTDQPERDAIEAGGDPIHMRVTFEPDDEQPSHGEISITHSGGQETPVPLSGNSGDACLEVSDADEVDFGPAALANTTFKTLTLRNCSPEAELNLSEISISDDGGGVFSIDDEDLPGALPDDTEVLQPGEITTTLLGYTPTEETTDEGELYIESDDSQSPQMYIPIVGEGVDAECPIIDDIGGTIGSSSGAPQNPVFAANQDVIYLTSDAHDPDGGQLFYEWSVINRPNGSLADIEPSATEPEPTMEVDIVGHFEIELTVYDEHGIANCEPAIVTVDATPTGDIHVQLVWQAPQVQENFGGPDPFAGIGTDLDLHYVHPEGYWGHSSLSVYWLHREQQWGEHGDVTLDIDDLYGADPENINHSDPRLDSQYRVGVHYYCDKGYGAADATVRIYFGDVLHGEYQRRMEATDHFWYVGNVNWSTNPAFNYLDTYEHSQLELNSC